MTDNVAGITYRHFETVDSTNTVARDFLEHGTLIVADEQTAGRGRYGNDWVSPQGNLYMSLVWRVADLETASQYSFLTAVSLAQSLREMTKTDLPLSLKWPNDILLSDKKISGILLEAEQRTEGVFVIVGCGINLQSAPDFACSVKAETGADISPKDMALCFAKNFQNNHDRLETIGFSDILNRWLKDAYGIGQPITVRLARDKFTGIFTGVNEQGGLLLKQNNGTMRTVTSGEVFFT